MARERASFEGGKGANQAVAAARLGADVCLVGRVGADGAGRGALAALRSERVDTSLLVVDETAPTGLAVVTVDGRGENSIVVDPGANACMASEDLEGAQARLASAAVTLLQMEIPLPAVVGAIDASGGIVVLNPAPAEGLSRALPGGVDVLVPNETELEILTGSTDPRSARDLPVPATVVTLGEGGAVVVSGGQVLRLPARPVDQVKDTTGAGDTFCGALAAGLDSGLDLAESAARAVVAASLSVAKVGARSGMPSLAGLTAALV